MMPVATNETEALITAMLNGELAERDILEVFASMANRPLTAEQLIGGAHAMRAAMIPVELPGGPIDTCGTGGSGMKTINTSTMVAFIVAAAGGKVAKHGNRSASGNCGCFDVLGGLGARIDLTPDRERALYDALGIVFLFAKSHHPAMRHIATARKIFGRKTIFNLLGPLCNPARVRRQIIGTTHLADARLLAAALPAVGSTLSLVVTGHDGLDEVTISDQSILITVPEGYESLIDPQHFGIRRAATEAVEGGSVGENVAIVRDLARGSGTQAHRDLVTINAAYALMLSHVPTLEEAFALAQETLASGKVARLIDRYIQATNDLS